MFQWDKSIKSMGVPVAEVVSLHRSMRDVQLALPGLPAQEATAYLCQHKTPQGVGTIAAFHLHKSNHLAFYVDSPVVVAASKAESVLDQALMFVESMGFLMSDLDIHLLAAADRELLWSSLPLQKGIQEADTAPAPRVAAAQVPPASRPGADSPPVAVAVEKPVPKPLPAEEKKPAPVAAEAARKADAVTGGRDEQTNVDDLLAAVEELRTRRPGVRSRKRPPSPEELKRRREELRAHIGRIWGSL